MSSPSKNITKVLEESDRVVLFGAGGAGRDAIKILKRKNIEIILLCDNDSKKEGLVVDGIKICSPEKLHDLKEEVVLIASDYAIDISFQLESIGVKKYFYFGYCHDYKRWHGHFEQSFMRENIKNITRARECFYDDHSREMFDKLIAFRMTSDPSLLTVSDYEDYWHASVQPVPGDRIIDAGAWTGDTACAFAQHLEGNVLIHSFEPDERNFQILEETIAKTGFSSIIKPVNLGLWHTKASLSFIDSINKSDQFRIDESGDNKIEVVGLDEFVEANSLAIDLIKMDIEGAEYEALLGAKTTIEKFSPKLQICIYHKPDDLWKIPVLIKELNPDYKISIGIHKQHFIDTVLYATVQ